MFTKREWQRPPGKAVADDYEERMEKAAERLVAIARRTERRVRVVVIFLGALLVVAIAILAKMFLGGTHA
jgi:hypothetical protein